MGKYVVTAERMVMHQAVVEASDENDAQRAYECDEWVEDLGTSDISGEEDSVFSVEEYNE